jgi:hypothetical protein
MSDGDMEETAVAAKSPPIGVIQAWGKCHIQQLPGDVPDELERISAIGSGYLHG